jgi:hypothetical protein
MAIDATVASSSGQVTLTLNVAYTIVLTEDSDYFEVVNGINDMLYLTIGAAEDEITVSDAGVMAVGPNSTGRFPWAAGQYLNLECASGGEVCAQLINIPG